MILEDIIIQSGVDYTRSRAHPDEIVMSCPFCTGSHDYAGARRVFGINMESGKAHCHRCDWRSGSVVYTAKALCEAWGIDFTWRLRLSASETEQAMTDCKAEPKKPEPKGVPDEYESFRDLTDEIELRAFGYLKSRGISRAEIDEYQIGYAAVGDFAWRVLFPVIGEDDVIYGVAGRDFSGTSDLKYRNTDGMKLLYNGQHPGNTAVVVEGPVDVHTAQRALTEELPGYRAMAALGSVITPEQLAQLMKYKRVIHFPDGDAAGVKGAMRRADITAEAGLETLIVVPTMDGADPGSMRKATIRDAVRAARPWTKMQKMRMRLAVL